MLSTSILLVYLVSVSLGIYLFDYQPDGVINNPFIIIGCIFGGLLVTLAYVILFLETTYFLIAKRYPTTSKVKHFIGKQIVSVLLHYGRIKSTVYGKENLPKDGPFLIFSNHTSELDIPLIMCNLPEYPVAFLAKDAVRAYPSIGRWAESIGCVMLNRENNRQGNDAISMVVENLHNGSVMTVFPEGTFVRGETDLLKFRSGAFKTALLSKSLVVPITIVKESTYKKKKWPMNKRMDIVIHEPIEYETYKDLSSRQLGQKVRAVIESSLK